MMYEFNNIRLNRYGVEPDIGGRLWDAIAGTKQKQQILEAALPYENYNNIHTFFDLMRRSGLVMPSKLPTESNKGILRRFTEGVGAMLHRFMYSRTAAYEAGGAIRQKTYDTGTKILNSIIWSPNAAETLNGIRQKMVDKETFKDGVNDLIRVLSNGIGIKYKQSMTEGEANED